METVREDFLHSIRHHVCEYGGDDAALRYTLAGGEQFMLKNKFQKLFEYRFVQRNVRNEPIVADVVKAPFDAAPPAPTAEKHCD